MLAVHVSLLSCITRSRAATSFMLCLQHLLTHSFVPISTENNCHSKHERTNTKSCHRGFLGIMGAYVAPTICRLGERSGALGALEGLLPLMHSHVVFHVGHIVRGVWAKVAKEWIFPLSTFPFPSSSSCNGTPEDRAKLAWPDPFSLGCLFRIFRRRP